MARILIDGDSQAGNPGAAAKRILEAHGHTVTHIHNDGQSPIAQTRDGSALWAQYRQLAQNADLVLLIFGHNDRATSAHEVALRKMITSVRPPVMMSGPPQYPAADDQAEGAALRTMNARIFGARYIDAYPSTPLSIPRDAMGAHMTIANARPWGEAMAAAVEQAMAPGGAATRPFVGGYDVLAIAAGVVGVAAVGALALALMRRRRG